MYRDRYRLTMPPRRLDPGGGSFKLPFASPVGPYSWFSDIAAGPPGTPAKGCVRSCAAPGAVASACGEEVLVQRHLHLVDRLEPDAPAFDPEVFIEQGTVEPFHDAVGLRAVDLRGAMLDVLEL